MLSRMSSHQVNGIPILGHRIVAGLEAAVLHWIKFDERSS